MRTILLALLLSGCGSTPIEPADDAGSRDVAASDSAADADTQDVAMRVTDASIPDTVAESSTEAPYDAGWNDPNCIIATGCDDLKSTCATGPVWAYGKWAYMCGQSSPDTTLVACTDPDFAKPPCASATQTYAGYDKYNVYWCCPPQ